MWSYLKQPVCRKRRPPVLFPSLGFTGKTMFVFFSLRFLIDSSTEQNQSLEALKTTKSFAENNPL
jgi:hypothetical protein